MSVEFKDHTIQVKEALNSGVGTGLRLAAVEIVSKAARLSRVRSGQLKGSWTYLVDEGARTATIGSPLQNAIWEEFGTGEYASGAEPGRKGGWVYRDAAGDWHFTFGKRPNHTLQRAFESTKGKAVKLIERAIREAVGE